MALPTLDATFASAADLPRRQMLAKWLVNETGVGTIADYYDLPERYLWAKIAVAAGAPRGEADYISLPKNYAWSDIYNAVAGLIPPSNVLVSGSGLVFCDGVYTQDGEEGGKPRYVKSGGGTINWNEDRWLIDGNDEDIDYEGIEDTEFPWSVTSWSVSNGEPPVPTVTEIPQPSPNHTDWSENVALGHIAAAYRGDTGNPANLATYIDWPWRYQVASIIDATSVCSDADAGVFIDGNFLYKIADKYYSDGTYEIAYSSGQWLYEESGVVTLNVVTSSEEYPWLAGLGEKDCFAKFSNLPNAVIVEGSGTASSDGTYVYYSTLLGRPAYILNSNTISWDGVSWYLYDDNSVANTYASTDNVLFPWLGTWMIENGSSPAPTLTPTNV
jgi:hypothetical protein